MGVLALGSNGVKARRKGCAPYGCSLDEFKDHRAGGTGIEPATCGFGESGTAFFPV